ncbi:MAG: AraC family transcriptional regulator [Vallitalea sp.]|jgi:AraC-like DNA-binding protein|nr:AraC family transcriptional regulator [Vallitalea sp.]
MQKTKECKYIPIKSVLRIIEKQPYHWHDSLTIVKVIRGMIKVRAWAYDNFLKQGDFIILNIGEIHEISGITKDNLVSITYIDACYCKKILPNFEYMIIFCNSSKYEFMHSYKYSILRKYIDELINSLINNSFQQSEITDINIKKLFSFLSENFDYVTCGIKLKKFSKKVSERNRQLYKSVILLDGEYNYFSLKDIADHIGVNYNYLKQDVVKRYGYGYKWLKHTIMIENAVKMILLTNDPIIYIGEICGFSAPQYMIKYFKAYFNCTPSQFRSLYRNNYARECKYEEFPLNSNTVIRNNINDLFYDVSSHITTNYGD